MKLTEQCPKGKEHFFAGKVSPKLISLLIPYSKKNTIKQLLAIFFLIGSTNAYSQNAILNGDFEYTAMPVQVRQVAAGNWNQSTFASPWTQASIGTPDIFSSKSSACGTNPDPDHIFCWPQVCTHDNFFANQYPRTHTNAQDGNTQPNDNYAMIYGADEHIGQPLQYSLARGSCYRLTFWVNLADKSIYASRIQVVLSNGPISNSSTIPPITIPSNALFLQSDIIDNKTGWTKVTLNFKAQGGENYITVGNFDSETAYAFTATDCGFDGPGCQSSDCDEVASIAVPVYFLDDFLLIPSGEQFVVNQNRTFSNTTLTSGNSYSGDNILLTGNITINGNVNWNGCTVRCNTASQITVLPGSTFSLGTTTLSAGCDMMWKGIVNNGTLNMIGSTINDADTAITSKDGSTLKVSGNSNFSGNVVDIKIVGSLAASSYIKASNFNHATALREPSKGVNGYPTHAIIVKGNSTGGNPVNIGAQNEPCIISKGLYGISADRSDINIKFTTFADLSILAIDYTNTGNAYRTLTVSNDCYFTNCFEAVFSHLKTNLTVTKSHFDYCNSGIKWYDNSNCKLMIGDTTQPLLGNIFTGCASPVFCYNNACSGAANNNAIISSFQGNIPYTDIFICNNRMNGIVDPNGQLKYVNLGIGLMEQSVGGVVSYRRCYINKNLFTQSFEALAVWNATGWGGLGYTLPPRTEIDSNVISLTTVPGPSAKGISLRNSSGWNVPANGISSDDPGNWQNNGIIVDNSISSVIVGNAVQAGTGIVLSQYNNYSNIYCNSLVGNSCGINLGATYLRDAGQYHGKYTGPNNYDPYSNYFTSPTIPYGIEIQNYFSSYYNTRWVWDQDANVNYPRVWNSSSSGFETNLGQSSVVALVDTNTCAYAPVYGGPHISVPNADGINNPITIANAVMQWTADYHHEIIRLTTGQGDPNKASTNIKLIIAAETALRNQSFTEASNSLASVTPSNLVEQNYKSVLTIFIAVSNPVRSATTTEKNSLISIAAQHPSSGGIAVYLARGYLFMSDGMRFEDDEYTGAKITGNAVISQPCTITPESKTTLSFMDEDGNELPISGAVVQADGSFSFDPFMFRYYNEQTPNTPYRIFAKQGSAYTVVTKDFKTLDEWKSSSPASISLSGIQVALDTTSRNELERIESFQSLTDGAGFVYSVGGSNSDMLLQKRDGEGNLIWSRTWNGPASGNDSATCLYIDQLGDIYIAGKVWTGKNYDVQVVKYDSTGFVLWSSLQDDANNQDNRPTGITIDETDNSVHVIGTCRTDYRFFKFLQCLPSANRISNSEQNQDEDVPFVNSLDFYPNPSNGTIILNIAEGETGTLELFTTTGQLVYALQISQKGSIELPAARVEDGVYLLKFTVTNTAPKIGKLIIQRNN